MKSSVVFVGLFFLFPSVFLWGEDRSPILFDFQAGVGSVFSPAGLSELFGKTGMLGGRLGHRLSDYWTIGGQYASYRVTSTTSSENDLTLAPITGWVQRDFPWTRLYTPYLLADLGMSRNKRTDLSHQKSQTGWTAGFFLGIRLKISDMQDLALEVGVRQFARVRQNNQDMRTFNGAVSLRFFLPQSWVPLKPEVDISDADLEIPLLANEEEVEIDPTLLAEEELDRLQNSIDSGRIAPITFDPGSAILQTPSLETLDALGAILRRYPETRVRIYGFIEESYTGTAREALASARAQVVGTYVVRNFYLNEIRLVFMGEKPPAGSSRRITFEPIPTR